MQPVYPKSAIALLDARTVALAWLLLALLPVTWLAQPWLPLLAGWTPFQVNLAAVLCVGLAHVALSFTHSCPRCGKHPTIQGFSSPHAESLSQSSRSGWAGVVVSILRRRRFVCIHCGAAYRIEP